MVEKERKRIFFDSIFVFNFFSVCLWQIVPFLSITTTGPMGTKVEIYIRLQFEKSKYVCVLNFFLPHLLPAACFPISGSKLQSLGCWPCSRRTVVFILLNCCPSTRGGCCSCVVVHNFGFSVRTSITWLQCYPTFIIRILWFGW